MYNNYDKLVIESLILNFVLNFILNLIFFITVKFICRITIEAIITFWFFSRLFVKMIFVFIIFIACLIFFIIILTFFLIKFNSKHFLYYFII